MPADVVEFDREESCVILNALERYAAALRYDTYYTSDALSSDVANDCDIFVGRILERFGDPRAS